MQTLKLIGYYNVDDSKEFLCVDTQFCKTKLVKVVDGKFVVTDTVPFHKLDFVNAFDYFIMEVTKTEIKNIQIGKPAIFAKIIDGKLTVTDSFFIPITNVLEYKLLGYTDEYESVSFFKASESSVFKTYCETFYDADNGCQRLSVDDYWTISNKHEIKHSCTNDYVLYSHFTTHKTGRELENWFSTDIVNMNGKTELIYSEYENVRGNQYLKINYSLFK